MTIYAEVSPYYTVRLDPSHTIDVLSKKLHPEGVLNPLVSYRLMKVMRLFVLNPFYVLK